MSNLQISQPLTLKSGLTLPNRLVKAAMAEQMAGKASVPTAEMRKTYQQWAEGGWGMILTGTHTHSF